MKLNFALFPRLTLIATSLFILIASAAQATVVDIMIVYDTTAKNWAATNGGMLGFAHEAVNRMNIALANSNIPHSFRLVHQMSVSHTSGATVDAGLEADLLALQAGEGDFESVTRARDTYGADLVAMLVDTGADYGYVGIGYVLSSWSGHSEYAHTVSAIRSVATDHTLTHEVGHNLGAHHATFQVYPGPNTSLRNPSAPYSAGYYFSAKQRKYHTIMAYNVNNYGQLHYSAPLFSTPLRTHEGTIAGDANTADNARLLTETMPKVARYKSTIKSLSISGPTVVDEEQSAIYQATAHFWNGSSKIVTPTWQENSAFATIEDSGLLTTEKVNTDTPFTLTASYTYGARTRTATLPVTIRNVQNLTSIAIEGDAMVDEDSTENFSAIAYFDDGTAQNVNPDWSVSYASATINSSGLLTTPHVNTATTVIVRASYTFQSVTKTDSHVITIQDNIPNLISLRINGPTVVDERSDTAYTATAFFDDSSSETVSPMWREDSTSAQFHSADMLTITTVTNDTPFTLTASYTHGLNTETDSQSVTIINRTTLGEALDNLEEIFTTDGEATWLLSNETSQSETLFSLESGAITDGQQSTLKTIVRGKGTITFSWKVSSETEGDYLYFLVDGEQATSPISGEVDWHTISIDIDEEGYHTLEWVYMKDQSGASGLDCGFVDNVIWTPLPGFPWSIFLNPPSTSD